MDLYTHFAFGIAVGLVFFGRPEAVLLVGLGTLLCDLDREYWFMPKQAYRDEQVHRAALHNVFIIALAYLISPFLSLGVFLHILQDSFTTVKDRGVEWFFPLTRLVRRGRYDADGHPQSIDRKEKVYFYQEDAIGLVDYADEDLREEGPVPWRRVYGPAQNSHILDRGFLFCSVAVAIIWWVNPGGSFRFQTILDYLWTNRTVWLLAFGAVGILFLAGELDRRDKPLRLPRFNFVKYPLFVLGLALFGGWMYTIAPEIQVNIETLSSEPTLLIGAVLLTIVVGYAVVRWQIRKNAGVAIV